ncbi:MAG: hypothetical protein ABI655_00325 [Phenylobacterium sp.]
MPDEDRTIPPREASKVDAHDLGEADNPQADWGEDTDGAATHGANHMRRDAKTEADRNQGARTRQKNKDIVSRRP